MDEEQQAEEAPKQEKANGQRWFVILVAGAQVLFGLAYIVSAFMTSSDAAGRAMAGAFGTIAAVLVALFAGPALIPGLANKALKLAVCLALVIPGLWFIAAIPGGI